MKSIVIKNSPLESAPKNEKGVELLFGHLVSTNQLNYKIKEIRVGFPDCIVYDRDLKKNIKIEFEYKSSNFRSHKHNASKCDTIVCWHHDWPDFPKHLKILELKSCRWQVQSTGKTPISCFGDTKNIWFIQAVKDQQPQIDKYAKLVWQLSPKASPKDILLMYRCSPVSAITDIFTFSGSNSYKGKAGWREGKSYFGDIKKICKLSNYITFKEMKNHNKLKNSSFIRKNMQGSGLSATNHWKILFNMIVKKNPELRDKLIRFCPIDV